MFAQNPLECIEHHWKKDCDHRWNGKVVEFDNGRGETVTCSKCGMLAVDHDCEVGP